MCNPWIRIPLLAVLLTLQGCSQVATKMKTSITPWDANYAAADASAEVIEHFSRSIELMQEKKWEEAGALLQSIVDQQPGLAGPWLNLGIVEMNLGNQDTAEAAFKTAINRNPANPVGYNKLGILYRRSDRLKESLAMYSKALEVAPDYADAHWNIGILYDVSLDDAELALQHYLRYQQLTDSDDAQLQTWINILRKKTDAPA